MQIYKDGVYKSCTLALYDSKYKSLGYGVVTPLPEEVLPEETSPILEETPTVPRPKARPRKGRK